MLTANTVFEFELQKIIEREIERARDRLESAPFDSDPDFRDVRGQIRAYREILNACIPEAKTNTDKRINS